MCVFWLWVPLKRNGSMKPMCQLSVVITLLRYVDKKVDTDLVLLACPTYHNMVSSINTLFFLKRLISSKVQKLRPNSSKSSWIQLLVMLFPKAQWQCVMLQAEWFWGAPQWYETLAILTSTTNQCCFAWFNACSVEAWSYTSNFWLFFPNKHLVSAQLKENLPQIDIMFSIQIFKTRWSSKQQGCDFDRIWFDFNKHCDSFKLMFFAYCFFVWMKIGYHVSHAYRVCVCDMVTPSSLDAPTFQQQRWWAGRLPVWKATHRRRFSRSTRLSYHWSEVRKVAQLSDCTLCTAAVLE